MSGELGQSRAPSDICKNHPPRIRHSQWCWHRAFTNHGNQRPDLNHDRNNCYQASFLRGTKRFWVTRCNKGFRYRNLRSRGKGRKLVWQKILHEKHWCWGCGCCRICCPWRHANGVPGGLSHSRWTSQLGGKGQEGTTCKMCRTHVPR